MAALLYVLTHSTEDPDRAVTGLQTALAAARAGHDVAVWLTGEGVRLGVEGVAETLHERLPEDGPGSASEMLAALRSGGAGLYLDRFSFERRMYEADAVVGGAAVEGAERLAALLAEGRAAVTL